MTSTELVSYTEARRDEVEQELYEKPEIHHERRYGLEITVYYLRRLGQVSMSLLYQDQSREFIIPNDEVNEHIAHPEYYAGRLGLFRAERQITDG